MIHRVNGTIHVQPGEDGAIDHVTIEYDQPVKFGLQNHLLSMLDKSQINNKRIMISVEVYDMDQLTLDERPQTINESHGFTEAYHHDIDEETKECRKCHANYRTLTELMCPVIGIEEVANFRIEEGI